LGARNYLYFTPVQTETEAHPATCTNDYRGSFLWAKMPEHDVELPQLSSAEVKYE